MLSDHSGIMLEEINLAGGKYLENVQIFGN